MKIALLEDIECSVSRVSQKQPTHIGRGQQIFIPFSVFEKVSGHEPLNEWFKKGMDANQYQPCFLRTERPFVRLKFQRGDEQLPRTVFAFFSSHTSMIFKNWI